MARSDLVGFAKQTVKGTGVFTSEYIVPVESANGSPNVEQITIVETLGNRFASAPPDQGSSAVEVTAQGAIRPAALPRLLSGFMGAPVTTTPSGGTLSRLHSFDSYAAATALQLHSILVGRADVTPKICDWFVDCYGSALQISCSPNDYLKFQGTWQGRSVDVAQTFPVAPTSDSTERYPYHEVLVYVSVNGGAEAAVSCSEVTISVTNEIDRDYLALGAQNPFDITVGNGEVTVSFTPLQNHGVWLRRAYPGATDEIKVRVEATGSTIEGALKNLLNFTAYRGRVSSTSAEVNAGQILKGVPVSATFAKSSTLAKIFDATCQNAVISY